MWVTPVETREDILGLHVRTRAHSDFTIEALSLDRIGKVPWWPETHRYAGHADIIRELIDGAAGLRADALNLTDVDAEWWAGYHAKVEAAAAAAD